MASGCNSRLPKSELASFQKNSLRYLWGRPQSAIANHIHQSDLVLVEMERVISVDRDERIALILGRGFNSSCTRDHQIAHWRGFQQLERLRSGPPKTGPSHALGRALDFFERPRLTDLLKKPFDESQTFFLRLPIKYRVGEAMISDKTVPFPA